MNVLLIFFALPIAVIIFSIVLQKLLKCPIIVASIIFSIFLVVAFIVDVNNFLVATIAYTILSFIAAYIVMIICRVLNSLPMEDNSTSRRANCFSDTNNNSATQNLSVTGSTSCSCTQNDNNRISVVANIAPNAENNGRTGRFSGCYRR